MDKIWDRKSFEVGGHWPLWRGWKNRMTTQNRQKSNTKLFFLKIIDKVNSINTACCFSQLSWIVIWGVKMIRSYSWSMFLYQYFGLYLLKQTGESIWFLHKPCIQFYPPLCKLSTCTAKYTSFAGEHWYQGEWGNVYCFW